MRVLSYILLNPKAGMNFSRQKTSCDTSFPRGCNNLSNAELSLRIMLGFSESAISSCGLYGDVVKHVHNLYYIDCITLVQLGRISFDGERFYSALVILMTIHVN